MSRGLLLICVMFGLSLTLGIGGCDESSDAAGDPSSAAATAGEDLLTPQGPTDKVTAEAIQLASAELKKHAKIVGDEAYVKMEGSYMFDPMTAYTHCKGLSVKVIHQDRSEADKLNGIEWEGAVTYQARFHRSHKTRQVGGKTHGGTWSDWQESSVNPNPLGLSAQFGYVAGLGSVELLKKNGQWSVKWKDGYHLLNGMTGDAKPVAPADLPK